MLIFKLTSTLTNILITHFKMKVFDLPANRTRIIFKPSNMYPECQFLSNLFNVKRVSVFVLC